MFRIGGAAEGLTSGLQPRQGYATGLSDELRKKKISDVLSGETTLGEAQDLSRALSYRPRGTNVYDFMTEMGLDLVSRPRAGNIFQQAATSAKEPYQRFMQRKGEAEAARYVSESDMFKTLIKAGATATGEEGLAGKTEQWKMEQIPGLVNSIATLEGVPVEERSQEEKNTLKSDRIKLGRLEREDPFVAWFLSQPKIGLGLWKDIKGKLIIEDQQSDDPKYSPELGEDDPQLIIDAFIEFRKQVKAFGKAEGGRVGHQFGQSVTGNAVQAAPTAMPTAVPAETMPAELGGISYEELRARLPQEIGDEIIRLLANSAEALEDFATIQTEQDISNFNKKYGVNLVLPAEG